MRQSQTRSEITIAACLQSLNGITRNSPYLRRRARGKLLLSTIVAGATTIGTLSVLSAMPIAAGECRAATDMERELVRQLQLSIESAESERRRVVELREKIEARAHTPSASASVLQLYQYVLSQETRLRQQEEELRAVVAERCAAPDAEAR